MRNPRLILPVFCVCLLGFFQTVSAAVPFVAKKGTQVRVAPDSGVKLMTVLKEGELVEVEAAAGDYYKIVMIERNGITGYANISSVRRAKTRGAFLAPLAVGALSTVAKIVISKVIDRQEKKFDEKQDRKADKPKHGALKLGDECEVIERKPGKLLIRTKEGEKIWIDDAQATELKPVGVAEGDIQYLWGNEPVVSTSALGLQVRVDKLDGSPITEQTILKVGQKYRISIRTTKDAYIRISAETPELGGFCQYYPNHFPGYRQSILVKAGQVYSGEFLPPGKSFEVGEPVGRYDLIRVEASTQRPFVFVPRGNENQGCQANNPAQGMRGGSFGNMEDIAIANPVPEVVVVHQILTSR